MDAQAGVHMHAIATPTPGAARPPAANCRDTSAAFIQLPAFPGQTKARSDQGLRRAKVGLVPLTPPATATAPATGAPIADRKADDSVSTAPCSLQQARSSGAPAVPLLLPALPTHRNWLPQKGGAYRGAVLHEAACETTYSQADLGVRRPQNSVVWQPPSASGLLPGILEYGAADTFDNGCHGGQNMDATSQHLDCADGIAAPTLLSHCSQQLPNCADATSPPACCNEAPQPPADADAVLTPHGRAARSVGSTAGWSSITRNLGAAHVQPPIRSPTHPVPEFTARADRSHTPKRPAATQTASPSCPTAAHTSAEMNAAPTTSAMTSDPAGVPGMQPAQLQRAEAVAQECNLQRTVLVECSFPGEQAHGLSPGAILADAPDLALSGSVAAAGATSMVGTTVALSRPRPFPASLGKARSSAGILSPSYRPRATESESFQRSRPPYPVLLQADCSCPGQELRSPAVLATQTGHVCGDKGPLHGIDTQPPSIQEASSSCAAAALPTRPLPRARVPVSQCRMALEDGILEAAAQLCCMHESDAADLRLALALQQQELHPQALQRVATCARLGLRPCSPPAHFLPVCVCHGSVSGLHRCGSKHSNAMGSRFVSHPHRAHLQALSRCIF
jgi:hypothetical protein